MASAKEVEGGGTDDAASSHGPRLDDHASRFTGPKRRSTVGGWTPELDALLMEAYEKCEGKAWKKIAEMVPGKTDVQCLHRYQKVLHHSVYKGPWTREEDNHLSQLVEKLGNKKWSDIAKDLPRRIGKQCRERWNNHLKPDIDRSPWTKEEDSIIRTCHEFGNGWAEISKILPGRTENSIKNRWNSGLKKKVLHSGNPKKLDEQLTSEEYPVTPLREYKTNDDVENALSLSIGTPNERGIDMHAKELNKSSSSDLIQLDEEENLAKVVKSLAEIDNLRKVLNHYSESRLPQTCSSDYFSSSLMSESKPAGQGSKELDDSLCSSPDHGIQGMHTEWMDNRSNLGYINTGEMRTNLTTPASCEASVASPAQDIQCSVSCSCSPEAILRRRATTFKNMPSIIRKRRFKASPETTPCNKIRRVGERVQGFDLNKPFEPEDESVSKEFSVYLPSPPPKPVARTGRNRPVEKSLKREFDAACESSDRGV